MWIVVRGKGAGVYNVLPNSVLAQNTPQTTVLLRTTCPQLNPWVMSYCKFLCLPFLFFFFFISLSSLYVELFLLYSTSGWKGRAQRTLWCELEKSNKNKRKVESGFCFASVNLFYPGPRQNRSCWRIHQMFLKPGRGKKSWYQSFLPYKNDWCGCIGNNMWP